MAYTYFIISPGWQLNSYVQYSDARGNYIKFGDSKSAHEENEAGLRDAYMTHNPDIGIAAVMDSSIFVQPYLGTRLANFIVTKIPPVPTTSEWFSVKTNAAWGLFYDMQQFDKKILTAADEKLIMGHIRTRLF